MALPKLLQKLFQNGGAGDKLNPEIVPEIKKLMLGDHVLELQADGTLKLDENLVITSAGGSFVNPVSFKAGIDLSATGQTEYGDVQFLCDKNGKTAFGIQLSKWADGGSAFRLIPYSVAGAQLPLFALDRSKGNTISCTIAGKEVERVNSGGQGAGYVRYESGLQLCYGDCSATTAGTLVTYGMPFVNQWCRVALSASAGTDAESNTTATLLSAGKLTTTGFTAYSTRQKYCNYIAIGYWK